MGEERGARQALNLDHERRLLALETWKAEVGQRISVSEAAIKALVPRLDELALAQRVAQGVKDELAGRGAAMFTRWQKFGITLTGVAAIGGFLIAILNAVR